MPASQNIICIWQSDAPDSMELSKQNIFSIIFFLIFLTNSKNVYVIIIKVPVALTDKKIGLSHFSLADQNSISEHSILQ
jgi:hypothetical protein